MHVRLPVTGAPGETDARRRRVYNSLASAEGIPAEALGTDDQTDLTDAETRLVPVAPGSPEAIMAADLTTRWSSPEPLRLCDDDQRWKSIWRDLARSAREVIREQQDMEDMAGDEDLPGFQGWTDQGTPIQDV